MLQAPAICPFNDNPVTPSARFRRAAWHFAMIDDLDRGTYDPVAFDNGAWQATRDEGRAVSGTPMGAAVSAARDRLGDP
jgi:hypothetical protein